MNILSIIKNLLGSTIKTIDNIIEQIPKRHAESIKHGYFFIIVVLMSGGAFLGYRFGGSAAGIKAPPLASTVREVFEYEIYKERGEGVNLDLMIESERKIGQGIKDIDKITFPAKEPFNMEYEGGIVDYKQTKQPAAAEMEMNRQPLDGKYAGPIGRIELQVNPLNKRLDSAAETGGQKNDILKTDPFTTDIPKADPVKTEPENMNLPAGEKRTPEKRMPVDQNKDFPKPITDGTGIIE